MRKFNRISSSCLFLFLIFLSCSSSGSGGDDSSGDSSSDSDDQNIFARCVTESPDEDTLQHLQNLFKKFLADNGLAKTSGPMSPNYAVTRDSIVNIPVFFHVISKGGSMEDGEVPDSMMIEQIDILNQAFSGQIGGVSTPFRFQLAGINRVRNPEWHTMSPGSDSELRAKEALKRGGAETANIYLVNIEGNVLGYTTLPVFYPILFQYDGIVINFRSLPGGSLNRYNLGRVVVHEMGHWLGLLHTFQGECEAVVGDLVSDTPLEKIPGKGEFCPTQRDSCPENEGQDPVHNHMTYTDDGCRLEFTTGQLEFMRFNAFLFRNLGEVNQ